MLNFPKKLQKYLFMRGVKIITGNGIKEIIGEKKVESVKLENGELLSLMQ